MQTNETTDLLHGSGPAEADKVVLYCRHFSNRDRAAANRLRITVHTARPGMVIGRGGAEVDSLRKEIEAMTGRQCQINIVEVRVPELDAQLVAENIAFQLQRRVSFRRAMRQAQQRAMRLGAKGIKIAVSGRLGGARSPKNGLCR